MSLRVVESERALVATLLTSPDHLADIYEHVSGDDFNEPFLRQAFGLLVKAISCGDSLDPISLGALMGGGEASTRLVEMMEDAAWELNSRIMHANQVAVAARKRKLADVFREAMSELNEPMTKPTYTEFSGNIQAKIAKLSDFGGRQEATYKQAVVQALQYAEERYGNRGKLPGISTGLPSLDKILMGFRRKSLFVLAAQTGAGKSALALNFALNTASQGAKVYYCSHEMSSLELGVRSLAVSARVGATRIDSGAIEVPNDLAKMERCNKELPIVFNETPPQTVEALRVDCQRRKRDGLDIVIVDYIQKMKSTERNKSPEQTIAEITDGLKRMAMELDVCVIGLSQLNNIAARNERPGLIGLRGSAAIAHDADQVLLLWSEDEKSDVVKFDFAKGRGGTVGEGKLIFRRSIQKFEELP